MPPDTFARGPRTRLKFLETLLPMSLGPDNLSKYREGLQFLLRQYQSGKFKLLQQFYLFHTTPRGLLEPKTIFRAHILVMLPKPYRT